MAKITINRFGGGRTYRWKDKDSIIDACRTVFEEEHLNYHQCKEISGVGVLANWFEGDTRKPQNDTVMRFTSALGWVRRDVMNKDGTVTPAFTKVRELDWRDEIEKQADWLLKYGTDKQKAAIKEQRQKQPKAKKGNGHDK